MNCFEFLFVSVLWAPPYPNFPKFGPYLHRYNSVRVHPDAHPKHMKVLNHFLYIQYGCGIQSVVVYSLNHDTTTLFGLQLNSIFQKFGPHLHRNNSVMVHPYPSTAYEGAQSLYTHPVRMWYAVSGGLQPQPWHHTVIWASPYPNFPKFGPNLHRYNSVRVHPYAHPKHPIWMWDAVSGGLQPQPWHHNVIWALPYPNFSKFCPHLHRYNSVRVHPYTHPQHMKVLKHFLYIQYGCGMQSVVVYSLNHDTTTSVGLRLTPIFQNLAPTCTGIIV